MRAAAQLAELAPGVAGGAGGLGLAGIAGSALLVGMFFAAGDAPQHNSNDDKVTRLTALTLSQLRCMADPYDTSAECAAVRASLSAMPFIESLPNATNAAQASTSSLSNEARPIPISSPAPATPDSAPEVMIVPQSLLILCERAMTSQMGSARHYCLYYDHHRLAQNTQR